MHKQLLLSALILLAACGDIVPATLWAAKDIDPLTADPADIAVRLDLPDAVAIVPNTATLTLAARKADGTGAEEGFVLDLRDDVLSVAQRDHARLRALQARILDWKDQDPTGTRGSLSVHVEPCRTEGFSRQEGRASVAIRLDEDGAFLPLVTDVPLATLVKDEAWDSLEQCQ